jgi:hypothetical protein
MRFTPKSEKEIAEANLLSEGEYPFEVSTGADKISKSGNEMIELWVRVYKPDGSFNQVVDYLLESMAYKLRHAAEACGLLDKYEAGTILGTDFVGKTGMLKLGITKDKNGQYPDKNGIKGYIVPKEGDAKVTPPKDALAKTLSDDLADDIPF